MMRTVFLMLAIAGHVLAGDDLARRTADRLAVERVYHAHRLGTKPHFEQAMPRALAEKLVRQDLKREGVLKEVYNIEITPSQIELEVERINSTTRAPEILTELKTALDSDPARFARTIARPIVVERELRIRFENDETLHAPQRREIEMVRERLLAAKQSGAAADGLLDLLKQARKSQVTETTWQLAERPEEKHRAVNPDDIEIRKRFGPSAQLLSSRSHETGRDHYFEDLPAPLQQVLRAQLRQAGDISAVVEMPGGFQLYLATQKTAEILSVAALSISKQSYEHWLDKQKHDGD